jgi:hypothetical protein
VANFATANLGGLLPMPATEAHRPHELGTVEDGGARESCLTELGVPSEDCVCEALQIA